MKPFKAIVKAWPIVVINNGVVILRRLNEGIMADCRIPNSVYFVFNVNFYHFFFSITMLSCDLGDGLR